MPSEILVKRLYIPDCKISLAFFVLYFHLLLIRSFIRIRSFFFVSWSLLKKSNLKALRKGRYSSDVCIVCVCVCVCRGGGGGGGGGGGVGGVRWPRRVTHAN